MSDQELKPCPFCQQKLKIVAGDMVHPISWCILSGVSLPIENAGTWNTRTPDPMLEELAGCLERMKISSCHCMTMAPVHTFHAENCRYRLIFEALEKYQTNKM